MKILPRITLFTLLATAVFSLAGCTRSYDSATCQRLCDKLSGGEQLTQDEYARMIEQYDLVLEYLVQRTDSVMLIEDNMQRLDVGHRLRDDEEFNERWQVMFDFGSALVSGPCRRYAQRLQSQQLHGAAALYRAHKPQYGIDINHLTLNNIADEVFVQIISAFLIGLGLVLSSLCLKSAIKGYGERDRVVTVRGLCEKEVQANKVTWPLVTKEMGNDLPTIYDRIQATKRQNTAVSEIERHFSR